MNLLSGPKNKIKNQNFLLSRIKKKLKAPTLQFIEKIKPYPNHWGIFRLLERVRKTLKEFLTFAHKLNLTHGILLNSIATPIFNRFLYSLETTVSSEYFLSSNILVRLIIASPTSP